ncbi:MAG: alkene reductase [Xanthomonadaceae bacterium]|jgi:N-ethylmaleimide reductase|nr:alkene reductase [Xanthomonadaceae bacterium]
MSQLFTPVSVGRYSLKNRMVMAPMTRSRADDVTGVPGGLMATYYGQRADAGLIVSEGTFPSAMGKGYVHTPGIDTPEQIEGWQKVADAVHAKGGRIFMQIMHVGRISHPSMLPGNALPVAPSAVRPAGQSWTSQGQQDFVEPHALTLEEVAGVIDGFRSGARNAIAAGFDGVELHSASGYLAEQFLSSGTNQRQDAYGGSVANRARFVLEALKAMADEVGSDRVGIKISPEMNFNDIRDDNPRETYTYLVDHLRDMKLAYLHVALFGAKTDYHGLLRPRFDGAYLAGGGLTQATAEAMIDAGRADAAVFGAAFIANPDLPERFRRGAALNEGDKSKFYGGGAEGYTDYPALT